MTRDFTGHWHGYHWSGHAASYFNEAARRPESPAFRESKVPPLMSGHWLLRPKHTRARYTWTAPEGAVNWLQVGYTTSPPYTRTDGGQAYPELDWKLTVAGDLIPRGVDVTWCYWTSPSSGLLASFSVVACPNRHHPALACPLPPSSIPREHAHAAL